MKKILLAMLRENPKDSEGWWKPKELAVILIPQFAYGRLLFLKMESNIYRPLRKLLKEGLVMKSFRRRGNMGLIAYRLTEKGRNVALHLKEQLIKSMQEWRPLINSNQP